MNIMRMTLAKSGSRDLHKLSVLFEILNRRTTAISHTGTDSADHLEHCILNGTFVGNTSFDAFRNKLSGILLEITIL